MVGTVPVVERTPVVGSAAPVVAATVPVVPVVAATVPVVPVVGSTPVVVLFTHLGSRHAQRGTGSVSRTHVWVELPMQLPTQRSDGAVTRVQPQLVGRKVHSHANAVLFTDSSHASTVHASRSSHLPAHTGPGNSS